MSDERKKALLWKNQDDKVRCFLCSHRCLIPDGQVGFCKVRKNIAGTLYSLNYSKVVAANPDPIEKKPLFHFQPGSYSFSVACAGCNFQCDFCQNWQISQADLQQDSPGRGIDPGLIVREAIGEGCQSIAYTYTEPTIFMEYCDDAARLAKENGLANVFVSNGYMTKEALKLARQWLDGINIDLKSFDDDYYRRLCRGRLNFVLETIEYIAKHTAIWMEITTLIVPGQNDSDHQLRAIAEFIVDKAGPHVPWHISRFYPQYQYLDSRPTPIETIERAYQIGKEAGLQYVYPGNVPGMAGQSTVCHHCQNMLIERSGFRLIANNIKDGRCPGCGTEIPGYQL